MNAAPETVIEREVPSAMLLASGIWYFRRMERTFADVI